MAGSGRRRLQDGGRRTQRGGRHVVVVESPAKARTIGAWLGAPYRVMATRGHVRDLPARAGSVDPGDGFSMVYETGKRAARTLGAIAKALARADILVLATDPDREGEAIAWQVLSWLAERNAVGERPVFRAVFHEVTPTAVRRALIRPRAIDMDLVRAWQARRALDYLVGYGLSPVLWRKLPGCRSAGRVQSVALRLVCEREAEIEAFAPKAYWTVEAELAAQDGAPFPATLCRLDGDGIDDAGLASERMAKHAVERIRAGTSRSRRSSATRSGASRCRPSPPRPCSRRRRGVSASASARPWTLRSASTRASTSAARPPGSSPTCARTPPRWRRRQWRRPAPWSAGRSATATFRAKPYVHRSRARHVQEAHEAIRPTDFERTPEELEGRLDRAAVQLYGLIRDRALASQMPAARFDRVRLEIASKAGDIVLEASGSSLAFDGHLRVRDGRRP